MDLKIFRTETEISLNGRSIKAEKGVMVYPGRDNSLSIRIPELAAGNIMKAVVEVVTPDGRSFVEEADLTSARTWDCALGLFAVPAVYEYNAGVVCRRGYRLRVSIFETGDRVEMRDVQNANSPVGENFPESLITRFTLFQGCTRDREAETFFPGTQEMVEYNDGWIPEGGKWNPFGYSGKPMDPPILFCLHPAVLADQDQVKIRYRLREDLSDIAPLNGLIVGRSEEGLEVIAPHTVTAEMEWQEMWLEVADWPFGDYFFEFRPRLKGKSDQYGPVLTYHRSEDNPKRLRISPFAPFELLIDESRSEMRIEDWERSSLLADWLLPGGVAQDEFPGGWSSEKREGRSVLIHNGELPGETIKLRPGLEGCYAVFLKPLGSLYLRIGDGLNRPVSFDMNNNEHPPDLGPVFITAEDMTGKDIEFTHTLGKESGVVLLQFIPVTEDSLDEFWQEVQHPPCPLRGIADWWCYFGSEATDLEKDQFDMILAGEREVGLTSLAWAIGRSWVAYPSKLPRASIFPCQEVTEEALRDFPKLGPWEEMVNNYDALGYPLERRRRHGLRMYSWLCMNRHYSQGTRSGTHTSQWIREHPEYNMRLKNGARDVSRVEYFFEEVRRERIDILLEAAEYDTDGIVVGWCRQPPHAGYHPDMVAEYQKQKGVDPRNLDLADGDQFIAWLKWRCEQGTTRFMRELREEITRLEERKGRRIPIAVRVPTEGFFFNMAMGMDVEAWIREELIDELLLDPLENRSGKIGSHDVRPYLDLCRKRGIPVLGGVNGSTGTIIPSISGARPLEFNPVVGLRMAIGLIQADVDGLEVYESERFSHMTYERWLIPLWGNAKLAEAFLRESNLEAVYPVKATNAAAGHDNHWSTGYSLYGIEEKPRGATRLI